MQQIFWVIYFYVIIYLHNMNYTCQNTQNIIKQEYFTRKIAVTYYDHIWQRRPDVGQMFIPTFLLRKPLILFRATVDPVLKLQSLSTLQMELTF